MKITRQQAYTIWRVIAYFGAFTYLLILSGVFMLIIFNGSWTIHRDLLTPADMSFVLFSGISCLAFLFVELKNLRERIEPIEPIEVKT